LRLRRHGLRLHPDRRPPRRARGKLQEVDADLAKAVEFLRSSLHFAGQDYLASRVLGKRRGRPRGSTKAKKEAALGKAEAAAEGSESAPHLAAEAGRKSDSAPQVAAEAGRKFDSAPAPEVPGATAELREIEQAPSCVSTAVEEIVAGLSETWSAPEKIAEGPCKPCTEPSWDVEVASFQRDTPKLAGQTGNRLAGVLRKASKRWSPWAWIGRFSAEEGNRRKAA
jgi:hypothetical protein